MVRLSNLISTKPIANSLCVKYFKAYIFCLNSLVLILHMAINCTSHHRQAHLVCLLGFMEQQGATRVAEMLKQSVTMLVKIQSTFAVEVGGAVGFVFTLKDFHYTV